MGTRYLVVGYEGRDHALAWKLAHSPDVELVYAYPGNFAMPYDAKLKRVSEQTYEELAAFAMANGVVCTIIGETHYMEAGIVDVFVRHGLAILGAPKEASKLEWSKTFAKTFMQRYGIPTAAHHVCDTLEDVEQRLKDCRYPVVMKADLRVCSQKSAIIVENEEHARRACHAICEAQKRKLNQDSAQIIVEEFLRGREISYTILTDGTNWKPLISVRDYKRLYDDDKGVNTGGMGSYAPVPWLSPELEQRIAEQIIEPTLAGLRAEGLNYRGFLYTGIMVDERGQPHVLEYNTRLGDTEGETILMMWEDDFAAVALRAATGTIDDLQLHWKAGVAVSIAVAPKGYLQNPVTTPVNLPFPTLESVKCFGSIIARDGSNRLTTAAGRMACVSAVGSNGAEARKRAYDAARRLDRFGRLYYRKDIGRELEQCPLLISERDAA